MNDDELIQAALRKTVDDDDCMDVGYYQQSHLIVDGSYRVHINHLYYHYEKWSSYPIGLEVFYDTLKLDRKIHRYVFINKELCNINLELNLGSYVRSKKSKEKKERLRQISSLKSKTKCED